MGDENLQYQKFSYDEHAKSCAPDDFLGQTRRTVQGVPLSNDQIQLIVAAIKSGIKIKPGDVLLDLACGNGALSHLLFDSCKGYLGVDMSEYLISVAKKNFEVLPHYQFLAQCALDYVRQEVRPAKFTKAIIYAGFQYFPAADAVEILRTIFERFRNIQIIFIGNLPDRDLMEVFYKLRQPGEEELSDCGTAIGCWRTKSEIEKLASSAGWRACFSLMPAEFYASSYRYDALLKR